MELDVALTLDGYLVVLHKRELDLLQGGSTGLQVYCPSKLTFSNLSYWPPSLAADHFDSLEKHDSIRLVRQQQDVGDACAYMPGLSSWVFFPSGGKNACHN